MSLYKGSPYKLISTVLTEYKWLPWKTTSVTAGHWKDINNQRQFLDWLSVELNLNNKEDWYNITSNVNFILKFIYIIEFYRMLSNLEEKSYCVCMILL